MARDEPVMAQRVANRMTITKVWRIVAVTRRRILDVLKSAPTSDRYGAGERHAGMGNRLGGNTHAPFVRGNRPTACQKGSSYTAIGCPDWNGRGKWAIQGSNL